MIEPHSGQYPAEITDDSEVPGPRWARILGALAAALAGDLPPADRSRLRALAWPLLRTALSQLVRQHASRLGPVPVDSLEDLAAEKSLELMMKCEAGEWSPRGWNGRQLSAFLSRVARNGVIDHLRSYGPRRISPDCEATVGVGLNGLSAESPATGIEAAEYATHLLAGLGRMSPRARVVWFLRVCLEWPSRRIAAHPRVRIPPSHVDVELQRTRGRLRVWMEGRGFDIREIPPGTSVALWNACVVDGSMAIPVDGAEEGP